MWCFCLALAIAGAGAAPDTPTLSCGFEDLSHKFLYHPLPTNLTIRPLSRQWYTSFTLGVKEESPVMCVHMESIETLVRVQTFSGYCSNGKVTKLDYLSFSFKVNTSSTLEVRVEDDRVLLQEPEGGCVKLSDVGAALPRDNLLAAVTEASGVEATAGCDASCPVHHCASTELGKTKVMEWQQERQQERLHFYFRPSVSSSMLQYEVHCTTQQGKVSQRELEIKLGTEGATHDWHFVELEQRQRRATVRLNNTVLQNIELPEICTFRRHVIWMVGAGSFSFKCRPPGAQQRTTEEKTNNPSTTMHKNVLTGIGVALGVVFIGVIICAVRYIKRKKKTFIHTYYTNNVRMDESSTQPLYSEKITVFPQYNPPPSLSSPQSHTKVTTTTHRESKLPTPPSAPHSHNQEEIKTNRETDPLRVLLDIYPNSHEIMTSLRCEHKKPPSFASRIAEEENPTRAESDPQLSSIPSILKQEGMTPIVIVIEKKKKPLTWPKGKKDKSNKGNNQTRPTNFSPLPHSPSFTMEAMLRQDHAATDNTYTGSDAPSGDEPPPPKPPSSARAVTHTQRSDDHSEAASPPAEPSASARTFTQTGSDVPSEVALTPPYSSPSASDVTYKRSDNVEEDDDDEDEERRKGVKAKEEHIHQDQ